MSAPIDGFGSGKTAGKTQKTAGNAGKTAGNGAGAGAGGDVEGANLDLWGEANAMAAKKGRGRPKGALNKHTKDFEAWYYARGLVDPLEKMGAFMSADAGGLLDWIIEEAGGKLKNLSKTRLQMLWAIIREQHALAVALAPYLHGKKPIQVQVTDERLPQLAIMLGTDQTTLAQSLEDAGVLSLGQPLEDDQAELNDFKGLSE